jgi:orotidine-5'-phosphate decarboxylase
MALSLITKLGRSVSFYKIGYQLGYAGGLQFAHQLIDDGKQVFLDFKLHDIGNTVEKGVESVAKMGASFLTVHAYPQTMQAAVKGRGASKLKILAVTVLTSYDDSDLDKAGYRMKVGELAAMRAQQARDLGVDGLVCSPEEASNLRKIVGDKMALVTPGIRPAGSATDDQKRIMTPAKAIAAGADYLVVGRPITEAADPKAAAEMIVNEIAQAAN